MPFIRYTRDKRGYESTFVMHAYRGVHGASRTRVLYFFRSPSSITVGRRALESEVMEALEHTHPDLPFDWQSLLREPTLPRIESRDRPHRQRSGPRHDQQRPRPQAAEPPQVVIEDETLLGKTVGARDAARLRQRYSDLLQRILRRARTPEERDRLIDRVHRLNPDEWADSAAILAAVPTVDAEWEAIASELPHRRRGRRGGRFRDEPGDRPRPAPDAGQPGVAPSGIIEDSARGEQNNENGWQELETGPAGQSADLNGVGDGGSGRADAGAEPPRAAGAGPAGNDSPDDAASETAGPDGPGVPGGDGHDPY